MKTQELFLFEMVVFAIRFRMAMRHGLPDLMAEYRAAFENTRTLLNLVHRVHCTRSVEDWPDNYDVEGYFVGPVRPPALAMLPGVQLILPSASVASAGGCAHDRTSNPPTRAHSSGLTSHTGGKRRPGVAPQPEEEHHQKRRREEEAAVGGGGDGGDGGDGDSVRESVSESDREYEDCVMRNVRGDCDGESESEKESESESVRVENESEEECASVSVSVENESECVSVENESECVSVENENEEEEEENEEEVEASEEDSEYRVQGHSDDGLALSSTASDEDDDVPLASHLNNSRAVELAARESETTSAPLGLPSHSSGRSASSGRRRWSTGATFTMRHHFRRLIRASNCPTLAEIRQITTEARSTELEDLLREEGHSRFNEKVKTLWKSYAR